MNKRALVYLGMASATLAIAFLYVQTQQGQPAQKGAPTAINVPDSAQALASVSVLGGKLGTEPIRVQAKVGGTAQFLVFTDEDDELKVHALDYTIKLPANQTTKVSIPVAQAGSFEMELQAADAILGVIDAQP